MIKHTDLGTKPFTRFRALQSLIAKGEIKLGGYIKGKIYGKLTCGSGKRMKPENRVFFANEQEAIAAGYRPCGNCLPAQYKLWKKQKQGPVRFPGWRGGRGVSFRITHPLQPGNLF